MARLEERAFGKPVLAGKQCPLNQWFYLLAARNRMTWQSLTANEPPFSTARPLDTHMHESSYTHTHTGTRVGRLNNMFLWLGRPGELNLNGQPTKSNHHKKIIFEFYHLVAGFFDLPERKLIFDGCMSSKSPRQGVSAAHVLLSRDRAKNTER